MGVLLEPKAPVSQLMDELDMCRKDSSPKWGSIGPPAYVLVGLYSKFYLWAKIGTLAFWNKKWLAFF